MPKHDSTKIKQLAHARGFTVRQERGRFILSGPAEFGPTEYAEARNFLADFPTSRKRKALVKREADELTPSEIDYRRRRRGYAAPLYEPELGDLPPVDLRGLHYVTVMLPAGADGDDALRGLWLNEDAARRRGCPAVAARIGDARALIASGDMRPVEIVLSDHDLASVAAYGADIGAVMLAGWLAGRVLVRGKHGPRGKRDAVIHN